MVDASLNRIYAGLIKFVAGGKEAFLIKYNSMNQAGKYVAPDIEHPCPTVATQNRLGISHVNFLSKAYSGEPMSKNISVEQPAGAITTKDHHIFISVHYGNGFNKSVEEPAPTVTTKIGLVLFLHFYELLFWWRATWQYKQAMFSCYYNSQTTDCVPYFYRPAIW